MQSTRLKRVGAARHLLEARDFSRVRLHYHGVTTALSERLIRWNSLRVGMRYAGETITLTMGNGGVLAGY